MSEHTNDLRRYEQHEQRALLAELRHGQRMSALAVPAKTPEEELADLDAMLGPIPEQECADDPVPSDEGVIHVDHAPDEALSVSTKSKRKARQPKRVIHDTDNHLFSMLPWHVFGSSEWYALSKSAMCVLIELVKRSGVRSARNGDLSITHDDAGFSIDKKTLATALRELLGAQFIRMTRDAGRFRPGIGKRKECRLFAITFAPIGADVAKRLGIAEEPEPSHAWRKSTKPQSMPMKTKGASADIANTTPITKAA